MDFHHSAHSHASSEGRTVFTSTMEVMLDTTSIVLTSIDHGRWMVACGRRVSVSPTARAIAGSGGHVRTWARQFCGTGGQGDGRAWLRTREAKGSPQQGSLRTHRTTAQAQILGPEADHCTSGMSRSVALPPNQTNTKLNP
jgi:hypothetical protein